MKMKTRQELIDSGFIHVSTNTSNDMECWAKFTGYEDCIQYIEFKEGVYISDLQVITYGRLCLFESMCRNMMNHSSFNQMNILEKVSQKWM